MSRLMWRLMPFLFLLYIVAYLDRINVGFGVLQMKGQLDLSDRVIGRASGMFFIGYFFFQLPSNLVLEKFGVRRWISALMMVWGVVSCLMIFIRGPISFYTMRFLLGAAEAGFFPGIILYMKHWFPSRARARAVAWFMTANPLAGIVGSPISGALLGIHGRGLSGWQWMFLLEGAAGHRARSGGVLDSGRYARRRKMAEARTTNPVAGGSGCRTPNGVSTDEE